jgi:hypothetical protein
VESVVAFCAVISRHAEVRTWARERLAGLWGTLEPEDAAVAFEAEDYYSEAMGEGLQKVMVAATAVRDPAELADWKLATNALEAECAASGRWPEGRPLNLDPGYISQSKLVLATVKDRDHRLYLRDGIFAEVTLRRLRSGWVDNPWTYRDYRGSQVKAFAEACRSRLRAHLIAEDGFRRC